MSERTVDILIEEAAEAIPCDVATLKVWLRKGYILGWDSFGRRNEQVTDSSTAIRLDTKSLGQHLAKIGIEPHQSLKSGPRAS